MRILKSKSNNDIDAKFSKKEYGGNHTKYRNQVYFLSVMFSNLSSYFRIKEYKKRMKNKNNNTPEFYHFIPLDMDYAIKKLAAIKLYIQKTSNMDVKFLDCGCGPGNILFLVNQLAFNYKQRADGIELDKEASEMGRALLNYNKSYSGKIWNDDILTFRYYKRYNVIYYYCPIQNSMLEALFEEILEDKVNKGTILVHNNKQSNGYVDDSRFRTIRLHDTRHNYIVCNILEKIKTGKRKFTKLSEKNRKSIPEKYHKLFDKHIKGLTVNR